jgi:hypothetical protein
VLANWDLSNRRARKNVYTVEIFQLRQRLTRLGKNKDWERPLWTFHYHGPSHCESHAPINANLLLHQFNLHLRGARARRHVRLIHLLQQE